MQDAWQPEALRDRRLEQLRATMDDYIAKHTGQVEANLPVFFGHVAATLAKTLPDLDDRAYDDFIDSTVFALLDATREAPAPEYFEKVLRHAMGSKRRKKGRATLDVLVGLKLIDTGNYSQALDYLARYMNYDARINAAIAYCYYGMSRTKNRQVNFRPEDLELRAREEMLNLSRARVPHNRLGLFEQKGSRLYSIFWFMLDLAFTWFPGEPEFYRIGFIWTKHEGSAERRRLLLTRAAERFPDNRFFLAEAFNTHVEMRKGSAAAAIVKQMMQQYPDDHEPLYYGMKLALLGGQPKSYASFRKLAILKKFPRPLLLMLDAVLEVMCTHKNESLRCFEEAKKVACRQEEHYITAVEYVLRDFAEGDEERSKRARSVFFTSVDQYCMDLLKIKEP